MNTRQPDRQTTEMGDQNISHELSAEVSDENNQKIHMTVSKQEAHGHVSPTSLT